MKLIREVKTAWLFDIDGVLTNPEEKRVVIEEIFDELVKRLQRNEPVGFNTGRSIDFVTNEILIHLESRISEKNLLENIFTVGEKGGEVIVYDKNGNRRIEIDNSISVPEILQNETRTLVDEKYARTVSFDETKKTMISIELRRDKTIDEFELIKQFLVGDLQMLLRKYHLENEYQIDPTRIAVDIQSVKVGKSLGARMFIDFLNNKKIEPEEYICFGDSRSDYDMYEQLKQLNKQVRFVFVGGKETLQVLDINNVIFTKKLVDQGTLDYLQVTDK